MSLAVRAAIRFYITPNYRWSLLDVHIFDPHSVAGLNCLIPGACCNQNAICCHELLGVSERQADVTTTHPQSWNVEGQPCGLTLVATKPQPGLGVLRPRR